MGLFGVFATMLSGGILFADSCKNASIERQTREQAEREHRTVWVDNKGNYRVTGTNEKAYIYGDQLKSLNDGRVIVDYGKERIKQQNAEAIAKAKAEGKKYCYLRYPEFSEDNRVRYLTELETGKRYYLSKYGTDPIYVKGYYSEGHGGISTILNEWKDETIKISKEEYEALGGYSFVKDTGVYYEHKGKVLI